MGNGTFPSTASIRNITHLHEQFYKITLQQVIHPLINYWWKFHLIHNELSTKPALKRQSTPEYLTLVKLSKFASFLWKKRTYVEGESISKEVGREILTLTDTHGSYRSEISFLGLIKRGEIYIKTNNFMRYVNQNKQQNFNKGGSFLRICGAVSVGEYNKVIRYNKLSW